VRGVEKATSWRFTSTAVLPRSLLAPGDMVEEDYGLAGKPYTVTPGIGKTREDRKEKREPSVRAPRKRHWEAQDLEYF
jgi:hypothetical protein